MRKTIVRIGDIGRIITGSTPSKAQPDFYGSYALWIKPTDIREGEKYTTVVEEMFSKKAADENISRLVPANSICVPCIGTVGTKISMTPCDCYVNQSINAIVPNEHFDNDYVYYLLLNFLPNLKAFNKGTASGREYIAKSAFEEIEIDVIADIKNQNKIGRILSNYDMMIANCRKQIALLEEAAQRLYREWFVNFRFPGHESIPIIDGLPQGWKRGTVRECLRIKSGKDHKILKDGHYPVYGSGGIMRYGDKYLFDKPSILIPRKGSLNNIMLAEGKFWTIDTMFYTEIVSDEYLYYVYLQIKDWDLYSQNIGAAVPSMNTTILYGKELLFPTDNLVVKFNESVKHTFASINLLKKEIADLLESRNMLLPRLMSGEIDVSEISEPVANCDQSVLANSYVPK